MAWRSRGGSLARSLVSNARASSLRSSPPLPRLCPPPLSSPRVNSRRFSFTSRNFGELGCMQSLLPLHIGSTSLTSHLAVNVRAFCELSHGTFRRSCPDR